MNEEELPYDVLIKRIKLGDVLPIIINVLGEISTETVTNCFNHAIANWSRVNPIDKGFEPIWREKNDSETEDIVPAYDDHYIDDESFLAKITTDKK